jgi:hypothetical protein
MLQGLALIRCQPTTAGAAAAAVPRGLFHGLNFRCSAGQAPAGSSVPQKVCATPRSKPLLPVPASVALPTWKFAPFSLPMRAYAM